MKTREVTRPDLVRASSGGPPAASSTRSVRNTLKTAEIDIHRDRRPTLISAIPAAIAAKMLEESGLDDSGGVPQTRVDAEDEQTRPIAGAQPEAPESGPSVVDEAAMIAYRERAASNIEAARAAFDAGDLLRAVEAAEDALREEDEAPGEGIADVIDPLRPFLLGVFAAYVGPWSGVPVTAPRAEEIARSRLGPRERELIDRMDGVRTLEQLLGRPEPGSGDAFRLVARCLRSGAIRLM